MKTVDHVTSVEGFERKNLHARKNFCLGIYSPQEVLNKQ